MYTSVLIFTFNNDEKDYVTPSQYVIVPCNIVIFTHVIIQTVTCHFTIFDTHVLDI